MPIFCATITVTEKNSKTARDVIFLIITMHFLVYQSCFLICAFRQFTPDYIKN
jgi:hypothetical protein